MRHTTGRMSDERRQTSRSRKPSRCSKPGSEIDVRPGQPVKHGNGNSATPQQVTIERSSTERDVVKSAGARYVRVAVTDHATPLDSAVDQLVMAVRRLPQNAWAHFHCEAGLGRAVIAACVLHREQVRSCRDQLGNAVTRYVNKSPRRRASSFSWMLSNPPLLKTTTTSFGRSIGMIRSTIAFAFCS
jgi:hypothetical protein